MGCQRFLHLCDSDLHLILEAPQEYEGVAFFGSGLKATSLAVGGHVVGEVSLGSPLGSS